MVLAHVPPAALTSCSSPGSTAWRSDRPLLTPSATVEQNGPSWQQACTNLGLSLPLTCPTHLCKACGSHFDSLAHKVRRTPISHPLIDTLTSAASRPDPGCLVCVFHDHVPAPWFCHAVVLCSATLWFCVLPRCGSASLWFCLTVVLPRCGSASLWFCLTVVLCSASACLRGLQEDLLWPLLGGA